MNDELLFDILDEIGFDGLPMSIQEELEELADNEGENIDSIWFEIKAGEYLLPRYLRKQLDTAAKTFIHTLG